MAIVALSYASGSFAAQQRLWALTARRAGFDAVVATGPADLEPRWVERHRKTLSMEVGAGCWLWKPYVVDRTLATLTDGDVLVYTDAGMQFVADVGVLGERWAEVAGDVLVMGEAFVEAAWTKRDAFVLLGADRADVREAPQRFASAFALRASPASRGLVARWLRACEDPRILTDAPNTCGLPDWPGFVAHRHDQSAWSLLTKLAGVGVPTGRWVAEGAVAPAGQLCNHTRAAPVGAVAAALTRWGLLTGRDLHGLADYVASAETGGSLGGGSLGTAG